MRLKRQVGFTLAELLIALAILGVIATFTIPKLITAQQNPQKIASAKETLAMVSAAYQLYTQQNGYSANTTVGMLTPYMNYVSVNTTGQMDDVGTNTGMKDCASGHTCLQLHNQGTLFYIPDLSFGGSGTTNAVRIYYDPDSARLTTPSSKSLLIILFYNGRVSTWGQAPAFVDSYGTPAGSMNPVWFNW
jgi:prepilin-type N-terminal cleavage/methylation domain-containing protein